MFQRLRGPEKGSCLAVRIFVAAAIVSTGLYLSVREAYADVPVGGSAGDFLQFEVGGRPSGMGGAQVGSANGIMAQYWNPAALATLQYPQVGAMHAMWLEDLNYEWIGYARPMSPSLGVGSLSLSYFHLPSISGVDQFGTPTGEFKVYDMAVTAGLARPIGHGISVGMNAKLIRQSLATVSATGGAVDLGVAATVMKGTTVGAVVQNLGPELSFDGASYPLPRQVRLGVSRGFMQDRIQVATDYNMPSDYYNDVRIGTEFRAHPNVSLRVGYRHMLGGGDDPANGLAYGVGFTFRQLNFDYAMTPNNDFDNIHRLSFGYSFGSGASEKEPAPKKPEEKKPAPPPAPTGPAIIAQGKSEPKQAAPSATPKAVAAAPAPATQKTSADAPTAAASGPVPTSTVAAAPTQVEPKVAEAPAAAPPPPEYLVVLAGFQSKEGAEAEFKALEMLGFKTKDAKVTKDTKRGGWMIFLARMKSKGSANEMASTLSRMSFRPTIDVVQR
jgi:hypothetical protein